MRQTGRYQAIADYYDAEYASNELLDHDVPFLLAHLPRRPAKILELCCGTARCALPLASAGHHVTGIDIDADLLRIARKKCGDAGLTPASLRLVKADVLDYRSSKRFDWAVIVFNTLFNFTSLAEQDRLVTNVRRHLRPGGRFWIDVFNPDLSILGVEKHVHFDSATFYVPSLDRSVHRTTDIARSGKRPQLQEVTFHYTWTDVDGRPQHEVLKFEMTWMMPRELTLLLERHGFKVERMYGDYDASPVTPQSPRLIVLARRPPARRPPTGARNGAGR